MSYTIKVHDTRPDGHGSLSVLPRLGEDDLDGLQAFYKFEVDYTYGYDRAKAGQYFWGVAAFELKAGPAILQPQVRGLDGALITTPPGILLFLNWPGTERFPQDVDPPYFQHGVAGFTEGKGSIGWGFGPESHIGDDGGPFTVWCSSDPTTYQPVSLRRVGSDAVMKLGWWDDHIIPNPIFQVMQKPGGVTPPTGTEYLANIAADGTITGHIPFIPGAPGAGVAALGLVRDGVIVEHVAWSG